MLWINHSWSVSHATPRKPIASVTRHRAPSRTHRAPSPTIAPHRAITSQSQQPIIHATISTCVYAFIHLFFILKTHQTREIQHKYSTPLNHFANTYSYLLRNSPLTEDSITIRRTWMRGVRNPWMRSATPGWGVRALDEGSAPWIPSNLITILNVFTKKLIHSFQILSTNTNTNTNKYVLLHLLW